MLHKDKLSHQQLFTARDFTMRKPLHIIHIEDSSTDSELVHTLLESNGFKCEIHRVETSQELCDALGGPKCDLILSDCSMPQFHGLEALEMVQTLKPEVPFIFLSGTIGEETAIDSLQKGATDYVLKQHMSRLVPAVRRALTEAEERKTRLAMEAQLRQTHKLETMGAMIGGLAHDFRNLLQILKMGVSLLPLKAGNASEVVEIAGQLDKTIQRGCDLMQELLVFARKTDANLVLVSVTEQIKEVAQVIRPALPSNVNLFLHLEESLPPVQADPGQVDRMLTNLIMNACDAMPEGGDIMISVDLVTFDPVAAASWHITNGPFLRILISDTGIGMDEETQARIFEPFFTTKPAGKGTGLGLSVVFGLMEAHQGLIDLQSYPGKGTAFSLFFPLPPGMKLDSETILTVSPARLLGKTSRPQVDSASAA
jgi:signal transduction histidine kinase